MKVKLIERDTLDALQAAIDNFGKEYKVTGVNISVVQKNGGSRYMASIEWKYGGYETGPGFFGSYPF